MKTAATFEFGIVARDLDALLAFYTDVLGLTLLSDIRVPAATSRAAGLAPDGYRVVRLETDRGDRLKLAQPAARAQPAIPSTFPMQRQGGTYLTFLVDDLDSLYRRLLDAGAKIASDGMAPLRPGVTLVLAADPEGNWIEFLHYDDIAAYRPTQARAR